MNLNLTKPIVFFDLEATGLNISKEKIIEIAIIKINPDQSETTFVEKINPGIPIPAESTEIHGITDADVKDCAPFEAFAQSIIDFIGDADLAGYNSNRFDIPFLLEELLNAGLELDMENRRFIDVQTVFHKMEQRTLVAAYKFYCDKDIINAHSAEADTRATYEVLKAQIDRYPEIENDMDFLFEFTQTGKNRKIDFVGRLALNDEGEVMYNFGKHSGKTIQEVYEKEPGYHRWIIDNDFPRITKSILKKTVDVLIKNDRAKRASLKEAKANEMSNKLDQLKNKFS
ncbi:MAG: DNA polymerase-3 subunit epsilon [Crocinitomix sp.]|jgi:DNA polymerase-3 subunit epsilon